MKKIVLLIVGPTAIGKTALSLELAKRIDCEIVSADSRQVYRYMDIGTAKPTAVELAAGPHHFINYKNPDEYYSAGEFGLEARRCIDEIFARGKQPLVVGGAGLYVRGLVDGFFSPKIADAAIKTRLKEEVRRDGIENVYQRLRRVDPAAAQQLHISDTQRILRALEVFEISGKPWSEHIMTKPVPASFDFEFIGLSTDRTVLYERIGDRVDWMLSAGLVPEVERLNEMGYHRHLNALQTVGYAEVNQFLANELDETEMVSLIKQKSRNYAKRQLTWFHKDKRTSWFELNSKSSLKILTDNLLRRLDLVRAES